MRLACGFVGVFVFFCFSAETPTANDHDDRQPTTETFMTPAHLTKVTSTHQQNHKPNTRMATAL
jgi:hypothetical protein